MKLEIKNLWASIEGKEVLKGVNLTIEKGKVHAIMGPNGSGKSTLSSVIMGHPKYKILKGDILLDGKSILKFPANERAHMGLFLGFQYPMEVPGVGLGNFLRTALISSNGKAPPVMEFHKILKEQMGRLGMGDEFIRRGLNEGFSGGEKKRAEILQMNMLKPKIAILDEPDSGTDVDALKVVGKGIEQSAKENKTGVLLITHYNRILKYVKPDFVHVFKDGRVVKSGKAELAGEVEKEGYEAFG
ncbi:MAG: Fe-S cluster assembly ATPase SufC [Candidatus Aenigmarchaeota archaeon]|nr:Fe-S cluster assembly ATPase SufC [Candidatus Aenigmarchaeota archaeon]